MMHHLYSEFKGTFHQNDKAFDVVLFCDKEVSFVTKSFFTLCIILQGWYLFKQSLTSKTSEISQSAFLHNKSSLEFKLQKGALH